MRNEKSFLKLKEISELKYNWNNNNALPISEEIIKKVYQILENISHEPDIFPTARESIQLEYEKENGDYLEFEIFKNKISIFEINKLVTTKEFSTTNINDLYETLEQFYAK